ncbi:hypothetical protein [Paraglaciecola sp. T6c]|uniref:hypothetical protein n=1 Tax=Pseudoalteromonas atlantica (strain T6c / ATCC BAA-1087) TaxID=3042615 RepID=UPI0005A06FFE|nr:hypothetical protein [Paraglaciecola sp. T6c]
MYQDKMKVFIVTLMLVVLGGCEAKLDKKVGYGKALERTVDKQCFFSVFAEVKAKTNYALMVSTSEENGKISYYELTIDGQAGNDSLEVFTPASFQLSKGFLSKLQERCTN